jgi:hypothetical protein
MPEIQYSKGFQLFFVDSGKKAVDNLYITMGKALLSTEICSKGMVKTVN